MTRERKNLAMRALYVCALLAFLARCTTGEMCNVDSTDPDSMNCDTGMDGGSSVQSTVFETLTVARAPTVPGLSYDFYHRSCPHYKNIVQQAVTDALQSNLLQAAGLTRLVFHDCFVQGCDASILLTGANSEQLTFADSSLRPESLQLVNEIKSKLEKKCPNTVSCADILPLAASEAIKQVHGPSMQVPVGRRDGLGPSPTVNLPSPFNNVSENMPIFFGLGLDYTDYVALSGAHTLGQAHCSSFQNRLNPLDVNLDVKLGKSLQQLCAESSSNVYSLDRTPNLFDNKYFKQILTGDVLLTSDAGMEFDGHTAYVVRQYARSTGRFTSQFARSFLKMSQLNVLTGSAGQIRKVCTAVN